MGRAFYGRTGGRKGGSCAGRPLPFLPALLSKELHLGQPELEIGALQRGLVAVMGLGVKGRTRRLSSLKREQLGQQQLWLSSVKLRKEKRVVALE